MSSSNPSWSCRRVMATVRAVCVASLVWCGLGLSGLAAAAEDFLDPAIAFKFSARWLDAQTVEARWTIADGYYMYHDKFAFSADRGVQLGPAELPQGKIKFDETFGKEVETHRHEVVVRVPVTAAGASDFTLTGIGQGCADAGLCYPPQQIAVKLTPASSSTSSSISAPSAGASAGPSAGPSTGPSAAQPGAGTGDDNGRIASVLRSRSLLTVMPIFFVLGVLLSFTPCVLPMVPILSSIIVGQSGATGSQRVGKSRGLALAAVYSAGMAIVYTALGIGAGLAGEGLAASLQQPWVLALFAALLVALAGSMFGFYELQLPAAWQSRLAGASNAQRGGRAWGVLAMGAISALIVGPCVAAPLAGALLYISQTRDVVIGGAALFSMAVGMSVPLLLVGVSAGALLPRTGAWMEGVKRFFGVVLLAVALWMVMPVLPTAVAMGAWAVLAVVSAAYLRAFDPLPHDASGWWRLWKGMGLVLALVGAVWIVGLATGGRDLLRPLERLAQAPTSGATPSADDPTHGALRWRTVSSPQALDAALASAAGTPVMLDFYADWCVSCQEMERFTFSDPAIAARLGRMVLLRADVTRNDDDAKALLKRFRLFGPPGTIFFDAQGHEIEQRVIGFQDSQTFTASLNRALPL